MTRRSALTTEYLRYRVHHVVAGEEQDPTGAPVRFAFAEPGAEPAEDDFTDGGWETEDIESAAPAYFARCLVGPHPEGGVALSAGTYDVWVDVEGDFEHPVRLVDRLRIE